MKYSLGEDPVGKFFLKSSLENTLEIFSCGESCWRKVEDSINRECSQLFPPEWQAAAATNVCLANTNKQIRKYVHKYKKGRLRVQHHLNPCYYLSEKLTESI